MKKIVLSLCVLASLAACQKKTTPAVTRQAPACTAHQVTINDFSGRWESSGTDKTPGTDYKFTLSLNTTADGNVTGKLYSVAGHGGKTSPSGEENSVKGTLKDSVLYVEFQTAGSPEAPGKAVLYKDGSQLKWKILKQQGMLFLPPNAVLKRCKPSCEKGTE